MTLPGYLAPVSGTFAREFEMAAPEVGFAVMWNPSEPQPAFYRSTDGGRTFQPFVPRVS